MPCENELDLARLAELGSLLGRDVPAIVATLLHELDRAFTDLRAALEADDLAGASDAAHSARNSALMIDARQVLTGLAAVETAARAGDPASARRAAAELGERWAMLRRRLVAVAG